MGLNPFLAAVVPKLLLPNRQPLLHLFDHVATCREGRVAMRRGGGDRDARLPDGNQPEAVLQHDARIGPPLVCLRQDALDLLDRHGLVRRVVDACDARVVPHCSQEDARAPPLRALDFREEVSDLDSMTGEVHHPPDNGGSSATSSPSLTVASSFTWRWFNAA